MRTRSTTAIAILTMILVAPELLPHGISGSRVSQRARLEVGPKHIDVHLTVEFLGEESRIERTLMDRDRNGVIGAPELRAYLFDLRSRIAGATRAFVDDVPLDLLELYSPEVELRDALEGGGGASHLLHLSFFDRMPATVKKGSRILFFNRLWPGARSVCDYSIEGRGGFRVSARKHGSCLGAERIFEATIESVPAVSRPDDLLFSGRELVSTFLFGGVAARSRAPIEASTLGPADFSSALMRNRAYLMRKDPQGALERVHRRLRLALAAEAGSPAPLGGASGGMIDILRKLINTAARHVEVTISTGKADPDKPGTARLPGDVGAALVHVNSEMEGFSFHEVRIDVGRIQDGKAVVDVGTVKGDAWVLIPIVGMPANSEMTIELRVRDDLAREISVPLTVQSPEFGSLALTVLSHDKAESTPAMVQLKWQVDGKTRRPITAVDLEPQFESQGNHVGPRRPQFRPPYDDLELWCVPGPFVMDLPPGDWEVTISRGLEHVIVRDTCTVTAGQTIAKTYRPQRWVNMASRGWYSGDGHVHCRISDDADARRLMTFAKAEDLRLTNVLEYGDVFGTYHRQRGFGPDFQVLDEGFALCPGQECPRTCFNPEQTMGHCIALNTKKMVRNADQYYLFDRVFDQVKSDGGLSGYAHVWMGGNYDDYNVHRDMSINVPKGKIDFVEILQMGNIGLGLYYEFLDMGFELTASAGSDMPFRSPYDPMHEGFLGDVRVYAHVGAQSFTPAAWFDAFGKGRTFVTNGPMIDFQVDGQLPGSRIVTKENRKLRVRARTWGDLGRVRPDMLEVVVHGEMVQRRLGGSHQEELSIDFEIDSEDGFWIAARAYGADGSAAHTTPVYVIREGLRFWRFDRLDSLFAIREENLRRVEKNVADVQAMKKRGEIAEGNRELHVLAAVGSQLLERVAEARKIYAELRAIANRERGSR